MKKAIIYFLVSWSGPERESRRIINQVLNEFQESEIPFFQISYSDEETSYVEEWLMNQKIINPSFNYGGYGEIILIGNGVIIDFIIRPNKLGLNKVREKISAWIDIRF